MECLMLEFVNDPKFEGVPVAGAGHVLLAERRAAGRACRWPGKGGDVAALAEFLGPEFPVLDGELYRRNGDRSLSLVDLVRPLLVVVPQAGAPELFSPEGFTSRYSQVVELAEPKKPAVVDGAAKDAAAAEPDEVKAAKAERAVAKKAAAPVKKAVKKAAAKKSG
jgi:hypothetical protein